MTERVEAAGTRTSRTQGLRGLIGIAAIMGMIGGCATGRVSNIEAYDEIAMNKVVPYPDRADLRKRAYELIVVDRPAVGIDASTLVKPRAQVRGALLRVAAEAGAAVIDQSLSQLGELRTEGVLVELEGESQSINTAPNGRSPSSSCGNRKRTSRVSPGHASTAQKSKSTFS
jgi:hypothetical protein